MNPDKLLEKIIAVRSHATHNKEYYEYLAAGGMAIHNHAATMAAAKANYERANEDLAYYEALLQQVTTPSLTTDPQAKTVTNKEEL